MAIPRETEFGPSFRGESIRGFRGLPSLLADGAPPEEVAIRLTGGGGKIGPRRPRAEVLPTSQGFILPTERNRRMPEFSQRREKYFTIVDGERQLNLEHHDIQRAKTYGNELLDNKKIGQDGRPYGLRVRAAESNQDHPKMLEMGKMTLQELVEAVKKDPALYLKKEGKNGSRDMRLAKDYLKATAGQEQWGEALFYHDAPVLIEGALASDLSDRVELAQGMVEDFVCELYTLDMIPNGSTTKLMKQSQPPTLAHMGMRVYQAMQEEYPQRAEQNFAWLTTVLEAAEYEFKTYWTNQTHYNHYVEGSTLVTPGNLDVPDHDASERETGNDMTEENDGRANDHLNPNINGKLIGYTRILAWFKDKIGAHDEAREWTQLGDAMTAEMQDPNIMFDGTCFVAYDARQNKKRTQVISLGGYLPLAEGVATEEQAALMDASVDRFRGPYGYAHILPESLHAASTEEMLAPFPEGRRPNIRYMDRPRQWGDMRAHQKDDETRNVPEWPIDIHYLIKGFALYGYHDRAIDIAEQWLLASTEYFNNHGTLAEKRNVLTGANGHGVEYPQQVDFGWSIGNYLWILKELPRLYAERNLKKAKMAHQAQPAASSTDSVEVYAQQ